MQLPPPGDVGPGPAPGLGLGPGMDPGTDLGTDLARGGASARRTFGDDVMRRFAGSAAPDRAASGRAATGWERFRGFERW